MNEIIPGVLEKEWSEIEKRLQAIQSFAQSVHIDIIDGKFAPNLTFLDPKPFEKYKDSIFLEVHLMVEDPIRYVKPFADAGFKRFLGHIEMMPDQDAFIKAVKTYEKEAYLALDGPTPIENIIIPYETLDGLTVMTIKAGFSGQAFMPELLSKVKAVREKSSMLPIEVDGGTNETTVILSKEAGASRFVATSYIHGAENPTAAFEKLTKLVNNT